MLAAQESHHTISFQGFLTDSLGNPLNEVVPITFKIYRTLHPVLLWTEAHPAVPVVNGIFNVDLGSIVSLLNVRFNRAYEVGISVDGESEMSPRTPLTSAPYAMNLAGALRVQIVDDDVDVFASDNIIGGNGFVDADAVGVTISGGGNTDDFDQQNRGYGNYGTIGGGYGNAVGG
ncbi:MAG TPA: hypothetical protein VMO47_03930, partial [Rhodothermales bacterium]|nr:hypothetical protein [Rhodothermales bacterium]